MITKNSFITRTPTQFDCKTYKRTITNMTTRSVSWFLRFNFCILCSRKRTTIIT